MTYIVNPDDPTTPTDLQNSSQGAEEFRALKGKVNGLVPGADSNIAIVRQTVLQGPLVSGVPTAIAAGTGLAATLKATTLAVYLAFASGFNNAGAKDYIESFSADQADYWATLAASNTSYLNITRTAPATMTAGKTLAPPQWGDTYDQTKQSLVSFDGVAGATTFLDDFGNTWVAQGSAKLQTNQIKFGSAALGGAGGSNALTAADGIRSTVFTSVPNGSWAMRAWIYPTAIGTVQYLMSYINAGTYGILMSISAAGKITFEGSSNGTSWDITAGAVGATTVTGSAWHFVEIVFDALGGTYKCFLDGVQETTVTSSLRAAGNCTLHIGSRSGINGFLGYIDAFEFLPYCDHPGGTTYAVPTAAPSITDAGYAQDWFDTSQWVMKTPSAASAAAATNPTFTTSNKVYIGEVDTSGAAVTAARTYAYQGRYQSAEFGLAASTAYSLSHNIGVPAVITLLEAVCRTTDAAWQPGDRLNFSSTASNHQNGYGILTGVTSKNASVLTPASLQILNKTSGSNGAITLANWRLQLTARRS